MPVQLRCREILQTKTIESDSSAGSTPRSDATAARLAVTQTLSESSLLQVRRRRITPPIKRRKSAKIG